jgi:hypothetical protein
MPISKIQVNEYQCIRCEYKWTNRVNGKDRPLPKRCAKCKTCSWDTNAMTPKENGLRRRIKGFKQVYENAGDYWTDPSITDSWSYELAEKFLNLNPPPTIAELERVVHPPGLVMEPLNSQNQYTRRGFVPDPENPDCVKYDVEEYKKNRKLEAQKRQQIMLQIIKKRKLL